MVSIEDLHYPAEIFGYPPSNKSEIAYRAREKYMCPFIGQKCTKQSRLLSYPLGICSAWHLGTPRIICPNRFYFSDKVLLKEISKLFLNKENIELVPEVELRGFGNIDWVGSYRDKENRIKDFCGIEVVSDSTTQTGELVRALKDFIKNGTLQERYKYGMNTYNTIKLSFTQIMVKGQVFEKWSKKYIWLLQDSLFNNLVERFGLKLETGYKDSNIIFYVVKMVDYKDFFKISLKKIYSTSVQELTKAFRQTEILPIEDFLKAIRRKFAGHVTSEKLDKYV
jgi:hypothetical protein